EPRTTVSTRAPSVTLPRSARAPSGSAGEVRGNRAFNATGGLPQETRRAATAGSREAPMRETTRLSVPVITSREADWIRCAFGSLAILGILLLLLQSRKYAPEGTSVTTWIRSAPKRSRERFVR